MHRLLCRRMLPHAGRRTSVAAAAPFPHTPAAVLTHLDKPLVQTVDAKELVCLAAAVDVAAERAAKVPDAQPHTATLPVNTQSAAPATS